MGELNRRGVKAFAVLSFMAFTSCAIAGRGAFHLFTPPPAICRHSSIGRAAAIKAGLLATMQVQSLLSAPKEESRCPESAARCCPSGRVKSAM